MAGLGTGAIAWAAVPLAIAWVANAWWLGRRQEGLSASGRLDPTSSAAVERAVAH